MFPASGELELKMRGCCLRFSDLESPELRCAGDQGVFFPFTGGNGLVPFERVLILKQNGWKGFFHPGSRIFNHCGCVKGKHCCSHTNLCPVKACKANLQISHTWRS